jgi:hypothetical protein
MYLVCTCVYSVHTITWDFWDFSLGLFTGTFVKSSSCPRTFMNTVRTCMYTLSFTTNPVHTWYIPCYSTVLPCTDISRYIPPCTTGHDSEGTHEFEAGCSLQRRRHKLGKCRRLRTVNSCAPLNRDRLYKVVCTVKCRYKAVLYYSMVCTDTARVTTEYILVCTLK